VSLVPDLEVVFAIFSVIIFDKSFIVFIKSDSEGKLNQILYTNS